MRELRGNVTKLLRNEFLYHFEQPKLSFQESEKCPEKYEREREKQRERERNFDEDLLLSNEKEQGKIFSVRF